MSQDLKLPKVGVGCLVLDKQGKVLLVRRAYPPGAGKWSIPGGHVELGEDLVEAATRELKEETGVEAEPVGVVNVDTLIVHDERENIKYHYVLIDVLYKNPKGEIKPGSDALEVGFYRLEEALKMDLTTSVRGLLEKITLNMIPLEKPIHHKTYRYVD
jgi:ADP-ribose pyrophosphatase YjhB (NUDIX family)